MGIYWFHIILLIGGYAWCIHYIVTNNVKRDGKRLRKDSGQIHSGGALLDREAEESTVEGGSGISCREESFGFHSGLPSPFSDGFREAGQGSDGEESDTEVYYSGPHNAKIVEGWRRGTDLDLEELF